MRKYWDKMVSCLVGIATDKLFHFIAGMMVAAFFAIVLGMGACIVPVFFVAFGKEFWDSWDDANKFDGWDLLATLVGGMVIELFVILRAVICIVV